MKVDDAMKKLMLLIVGGGLFVLSLVAETEYVTGYTWTFSINGDMAEISAISPNPVGVVTIPSTLGGKPVMSIGGWAFNGCNGMTNVTIPEGVTSIGKAAFQGCYGLTNMMIPDSVTSIGESAFNGCRDLLFDTMMIPGVRLVDYWVVGNTGTLSGALDLSGVRGVGDAAFSGCSSLTSVLIPEGVRRISPQAFYGCNGLTSVTIPDSVTSIGGNAFYDCSSLTNMTIPNGVTIIEDYAFRNCSSLMSVSLPESMTSIGEYAFLDCSNLTNMRIPGGVTSIGAGAFNGTPFYNNQPDGLVVLGKVAYKYKGMCPITVTIPDGVTSVGDSAFLDCGALMSVTIPNSVTSIGSHAFAGCSGLTSVTIPDSVTNVGAGAFYGCNELTNVTIGSGVTSLSPVTFTGCGKLWTAWYRILSNSSSGGGLGYNSPSVVTSVVHQVVTTVVQQVEACYALTNRQVDRAVASITLSNDTALDEFVLTDGKVYDSVLYVVNTATVPVRLSLPAGHTYVTVSGLAPLLLPASSTNLVTITRMASDTFLVTRQGLEAIK